MTIAAMRERLHDLISEVDDKKIESIYALMGDQVAGPYEWSEDEEFVAELEDRMRRIEEGIDKGVTWEELKANIEELRKKQPTNE